MSATTKRRPPPELCEMCEVTPLTGRAYLMAHQEWPEKLWVCATCADVMSGTDPKQPPQQYQRRAHFFYLGTDITDPSPWRLLPPDAAMDDLTDDSTDAEMQLIAARTLARRRAAFGVGPGHDFSDDAHPANRQLDAALIASHMLSEDSWYQNYGPVHEGPLALSDATLAQFDVHHVWTQMQSLGPDDIDELRPGLHHVNRLGHWITRIPWSDQLLIVTFGEPGDEEEDD